MRLFKSECMMCVFFVDFLCNFSMCLFFWVLMFSVMRIMWLWKWMLLIIIMGRLSLFKGCDSYCFSCFLFKVMKCCDVVFFDVDDVVLVDGSGFSVLL